MRSASRSKPPPPFGRDLHFNHGADNVRAGLLLVQHGAIAEDNLLVFISFDLRRDLGRGQVEHLGQLLRLQRRVFLQKSQ